MENKWKAPHTTLLLIAVTVAALATFVVYPGVMYSDSYGRAGLADMMVKKRWIHLISRI